MSDLKQRLNSAPHEGAVKHFLLTIYFIISGMGIMSDIQAVTDTSEYKKPYYTVQISYAGTGSEYRLNDIPFYLENFEGQVDTEIPVGDKMIQGINTLSIIAFPYSEGKGSLPDWTHEDARVEATLYVREKDAPKVSRKMLTHVKLHPARDPRVAGSESMVVNEQALPMLDYKSKPRQFPNTVYHKQIVISRKTHPIKSPFPRWEWEDGEVIKETEENYKSLLEAYRKQYVIHQKQDLVALKTSCRKLAETQKLINNYDNIEKAYEMLNLEESWKSEEQELFDFIEGDRAKKLRLKLDIVANGKLARIVNDDSIQPVMYIVKKARVMVKYKYLFYKNKNGEWVYIM